MPTFAALHNSYFIGVSLHRMLSDLYDSNWLYTSSIFSGIILVHNMYDEGDDQAISKLSYLLMTGRERLILSGGGFGESSTGNIQPSLQDTCL